MVYLPYCVYVSQWVKLTDCKQKVFYRKLWKAIHNTCILLRKTFSSLAQFIYACAPIPMQQLPELREKYTYNIRPFTSAGNSNRKAGSMLPSDEDDLDEEDLEAISCFTGIIPTANGANRGKGDKAIFLIKNHVKIAQNISLIFSILILSIKSPENKE